jgi:hypothetical protein
MRSRNAWTIGRITSHQNSTDTSALGPWTITSGGRKVQWFVTFVWGYLWVHVAGILILADVGFSLFDLKLEGLMRAFLKAIDQSGWTTTSGFGHGQVLHVVFSSISLLLSHTFTRTSLLAFVDGAYHALEIRWTTNSQCEYISTIHSNLTLPSLRRYLLPPNPAVRNKVALKATSHLLHQPLPSLFYCSHLLRKDTINLQITTLCVAIGTTSQHARTHLSPRATILPLGSPGYTQVYTHAQW